MKRYFACLAFLLSGSMHTALAVSHYVDPSNHMPNSPYTSWADAANNIQAAVDVASSGDTVVLASATYRLTDVVTLTGGITIEPRKDGTAIIDGQGSTQCFRFSPKNSATATLKKLTIINGYSTSNGGGVYCNSSGDLQVEKCTIKDCYAGNYGGGMYGGTANNCCIESNRVSSGYPSFGGGMSDGVANSCLFTGNSADYGGGVRNSTVQNCTISGNNAGDDGGGLYDGTANNCIIWGNNAAGNGNEVYGSGTWEDVHLNYSCSQGVDFITNGVNGCITSNPLMVDPANGDFRLLRNSPCLNAGNNAYVDTTSDLDGDARIADGTVDMGAIEGIKGPFTFYINGSNSNDEEPYTSPETAAKRFHQIFDSNLLGDGDTVIVSDDASYDLMVPVVVEHDITIMAEEDGDDIRPQINGYLMASFNRGSCFVLGTNNCELIGLEIAHGVSTNATYYNGGGVSCEDTTPIVRDCYIHNCKASYLGGGMIGGTAIDCEFKYNEAGNDGGGMAFGVARGCLFQHNHSQRGGGGLSDSSLTSCTIAENTSENYGGGLSVCKATNCLIRANSAEGDAGGGASNGSLINCTVVGNHSDTSGGGAQNATLKNTILWGNTAPNHPNYDQNSSSAEHSCSPDLTHNYNGCTTNAPLFADAVNDDYHLIFGSPCIDTGNTGATTETSDLDGNTRVINTTVDMGAFEFQFGAGVDSDGDGMEDLWEQEQFGGNVEPTDNEDGDPMDNLAEYIAGTEATNAASFLEITQVDSVPNGLTLHWDAIAGRTYGVSWSTNLTIGSFEPIAGIDMPYPQDTCTVSNTTDAVGFYKINVRKN